MGEVWAAAIGAATAIAGTAYSISSSQAAIDAANSAKPAKFVPVDITATALLAAETDQNSYKLSDEDWAKRFPDLVAGRTFNIKDASSNLEGGTSKQISDTLEKSGLDGDIGDTEFEQAKNLGQPILAKEQRDRRYFQQLLGDNPKRQIGLSGSDVAHIAIANTASQTNYNQGVFGSRINQYNASVQQSAQNAGAIIGGIGGLATIGSNIFQDYQINRNNSLSPDYYDSTDPTSTFELTNPNTGDEEYYPIG